MFHDKSIHFVYVRALIMCKSKDAVIASYHWAVLHTPVDTRAIRAMYYVSSLLPLFVSRTFRYGRGERQDCKKKDCKGDRVGVFQWLARLAHLARTFGSLARTLATLNALQISSLVFGFRWAQRTKPCFVTLRTFFNSTAGQGFQNTKWPGVLYSQ